MSWGDKSGHGYMPDAYGWYGNTGVAAARGAGRHGMQIEFMERWDAMLNWMTVVGVGACTSTDWFRDYDTQVHLKVQKPNLAATPGRSVHGTGYATDDDATDAQRAWMDRYMRQWGFCKPVHGEPWHSQLEPRYATRTSVPAWFCVFHGLTGPWQRAVVAGCRLAGLYVVSAPSKKADKHYTVVCHARGVRLRAVQLLRKRGVALLYLPADTYAARKSRAALAPAAARALDFARGLL